MEYQLEIKPTNKYRHNEKAISIGNAFWNESQNQQIAGIVADLKDGVLTTSTGHQFVNFSCCSYLDLDSHPQVIEGAVHALRKYGVLDHCIPRTRVQIPALLELESRLSDLFEANAVAAISASVASIGLLPLVASGHLMGPGRPLMIFDKNCHVSLSICKPICADETEVVTCRHHDLDFIEEQCKKYEHVCYVCDGSDSMGGYAPIKELLALQDKYGLRLFLDDCHSISIKGKKGEGFIRSNIDRLNNKTVIIATLNKAFGASGAAVLFGPQNDAVFRIVDRFAGPLAYSQPMNTAAIGGCMASAEIHCSDELGMLQDKLQDNIALFDALVKTPQHKAEFPIRLVKLPDDKVIECGKKVFEAGFYTSPVFFPIIARGSAALRIMMRAGQTKENIQQLCATINSFEAYHVE